MQLRRWAKDGFSRPFSRPRLQPWVNKKNFPAAGLRPGQRAVSEESTGLKIFTKINYFRDGSHIRVKMDG
jgi:hypothetical protein